MNKYKQVLFSVLFFLFLTLVSAQKIDTKKIENRETVLREASLKYHYLLNLLDNVYVDTVDVKKLVERAMVSTLEQLDPHSVYMNEKEVKDTEEMMSGEFSGIGIEFNILRDTLMVISTIDGGPSERAGLMAGDRIVQIDKEKVTNIGLTNTDVAKRLRGERGTEVKIYVKRLGEHKLLDFLIIRDNIPLFTIDATYMLSDDIGYIKINRFGEKTVKEFRQGLVKLKELGMKKLIIDLTGNTGGYIGAAVGVLDQLLADIKLAVYVEGLHSPRKDFMTLEDGLAEDIDVVVMIDEGSASASEIVAGALQDWDRGVLVGRRSFGKGLVQNQFPMPDGSAVRITTGYYYTPTGRSIQKSFKDGVKDYFGEIAHRYFDGEMLSVDSIHFPDSLKYETLINKRIVYGGGGIMPDIFVPLDTTQNFSYMNALYRKNIIYPYALDYVDLHREELGVKYPTFEVFYAMFDTPESMLEELKIAGEKLGVKREEASYLPIKEHLKNSLKALVARGLWGFDAYYQVMNEQDAILQKSKEILEKNKSKEILKIKIK